MNEAPRTPPRRTRIGFFMHGKTIWFSELLAFSLVTLLLLSLLAMNIAIVVNYFSIENHDRRIASLRKEQVVLADSLGVLEHEMRIITLLRSIAGRNVQDHALAEVARIVSRSSVQYGYDPLLLLAVIHVESVFNATARGRYISGAESGVFGLMQLKFETAAEIAGLLGMPPLTEKKLMAPETNLVIGVAYLTRLIAQFRSFKLGLLAYNQGPGTIYQTLRAREPLSNEYYQKVLKSYFSLKKRAAKIEK